MTGGPPYQPAIWRSVSNVLDRVRNGDPLVLVGHSGAGPLLSGIAAACGDSVHAPIYVDAGLPEPGKNWFERAPAEMADHLHGLAENGLLPPWNEWFAPGAIDSLLPDPQLRERFRAELPCLPLAFLDEPAPPVTWAGPGGYLLLSEAYRRDAAEARRNGWPVREHLTHHLAMLTQPRNIASTLGELCQLLVTDSGRG
jgi:pimeloyl-ACP methyl ester carboxylesterase